MKKKFFVATAAFILTLSAAFAQDATPVPDAIVKELNQEFSGASNVQWKTTPNFYKASFTVDAQPLEAFYSFDGQLIAVSRKIRVEQLPMALIKEAKEQGSLDQVTDLFELSSDRGTEYFITFGAGNEAKIYKSGGYMWSRYDGPLQINK